MLIARDCKEPAVVSTTDEAIMPTRGGDWYDGGFWQGLFLHKWGVNNDAIQATWEYLYKVIMLSNNSLEHIETYALTHSDAELPGYRAEVRAFRAMYYYYLMDLFGRIPLVLHSNVASKDIVLSERKNVFDFVVRELQETAPLLPAQFSNRSGNYYGRLTRPVAYFLLAKLALNTEIYTDNNWTDGVRPDGKNIFFEVDGTTINAWQTAEAYCDKITAFGYRLEPDYTANFAVYNESSVENIFTVPMSKTLYTNQMQYLFRSRHYNHAKALGLSGENGSSATIEALQTFGYDTDLQDPRFDFCYYAGTVYDLKGNVVKLDDGTVLVYEPWKVKLDISDEPYEKTAGARMKKYEIDDKAMKDTEKKLYGKRASHVMKTDIKEMDNGYQLVVDLPGFTKDEIKASLENGYLTISAEKGLDKDEQEKESGHYIRRERYAGACSRSFYVGEDVQQEDIKAEFKHGILKLFVPKKEAKPAVEEKKHIAIEG